MTRRFAIHPPLSLLSQTVRELALSITHFTRQDYDAGLWPSQDIHDKVRAIIAESTGVPLSSVKADTKWTDLC
jgi:hypothetical protein